MVLDDASRSIDNTRQKNLGGMHRPVHVARAYPPEHPPERRTKRHEVLPRRRLPCHVAIDPGIVVLFYGVAPRLIEGR